MFEAVPISLDTFQSVLPEDEDRILGGVHAITCVLSLLPPWLLKGAIQWLERIIHASSGSGPFHSEGSSY